MYELNTSFTMTDRSTWEADKATAKEWHAANGASDHLICEFLTGVGAGTLVNSARFETMDDVAKFMRAAITVATDPAAEQADMRARFTLVGRALNRVINEVGERAGPCLSVTINRTSKPVPVDENLHAMELFVKNGAKGASTVMAIDGNFAGCYLVAVYGDTFNQIDTAIEAGLTDDRLLAAIVDTGTKRVGQIYMDVS